MATHHPAAPITNVVTPISDLDPTSAEATVDAALKGLVLGTKFDKIAAVPPGHPLKHFDFDAVNTAASLADAITGPEIPSLVDCEFVPLQPSVSRRVEERICREKIANPSEEAPDAEILEAASILCMLCDARPNSDDVEPTMDMLAPTFSYETEAAPDDDATVTQEEEEESEEEYQDEDMYEAPLPKKSTRHPDRLAIEEDIDEVNKLHQYVRSDLLEIFVVPQVEEDDSDDESYNPKQSYERVTRGNSYTGTTTTYSGNSRHYPGRVGFRCVHCANVRPSTAQATKSSFYPLRVHNLYREVCAWQRIHFKNCPFVPKEVRGRYDWLKQSDTSRGKVRYWEISAGKIGLVNNPDRCVYMFAWIDRVTCIDSFI